MTEKILMLPLGAEVVVTDDGIRSRGRVCILGDDGEMDEKSVWYSPSGFNNVEVINGTATTSHKPIPEVSGTRTIQQIVTDIEAAKVHLAEDRDKLRDLLYEIEDLMADKDEDIAKLDEVVDSLSRYV